MSRCQNMRVPDGVRCTLRDNHEGYCQPQPRDVASRLPPEMAYDEGYQHAITDVAAWHRERARHYELLNHLATWHNEAADALESGAWNQTPTPPTRNEPTP